jgi:hypothetical protein
MRTGAIIGRGTALAVIGTLMAGAAIMAQTLERQSPETSKSRSTQTPTAPQTQAATTQQPPPRSFSPPPGALVAPGDPPQLTLLYTGNVVGYLDPCG